MGKKYEYRTHTRYISAGSSLHFRAYRQVRCRKGNKGDVNTEIQKRDLVGKIRNERTSPDVVKNVGFAYAIDDEVTCIHCLFRCADQRATCSHAHISETENNSVGTWRINRSIETQIKPHDAADAAQISIWVSATRGRRPESPNSHGSFLVVGQSPRRQIWWVENAVGRPDLWIYNYGNRRLSARW
jgi:hypothetical protein